MRKVVLYSLLLIAGLIGSQLMGDALVTPVRLLTMLSLAFIMIHVGYEFEIDKSRPMDYAWDATVAFTAATLPWILCTAYFLFVLTPPAQWWASANWKSALLEGLFAAPTSAGVLFSMLAAAGLAATWVFRKARVLAIFDDLSTILCLIPLKVMLVGLRWQLGVVAIFLVALLWLSWRYLNRVALPVAWPWVMCYAVLIVAASEAIDVGSRFVDPSMPIQLEVLLPAFALGCILKTPPGQDPHVNDAIEGTEEGPETPIEQRVSTIVSAGFMVLVGLSMPPIELPAGVGWGLVAAHVVVITLLSNLGKMFPLLCYAREATLRERLALSIGMWPRGEVGAGVLVVAMSYNMRNVALTVAVLSLSLNLLCTGLFILIVKRLLAPPGEPAPEAAVAQAGTVPNEETSRVE